MFPPLSRQLDAAAAAGAAGGSTDDGYLSDKSTPHPPTSSSSSPLSSAGYTDDTCPDMETMMAVEDEVGSEDEAMEDDYPAASVPGTPTSLMPTIDQLFKRSFSQELEQLTSSSSCHSSSSSSLQQLPEDLIMRTSESDQQLVILEDIQQILRDEANFELCV
jgi:hypothetical protein